MDPESKSTQPTVSNNQGKTISEVKLGDGIYFTDYRRGASDPGQHQLNSMK